MAQGREGEVAKLNPRQEKFCQLYVSEEFFGNGVQTYIEVYEIDESKPNWYRSACSAASRLLSDVKVCQRINELLDDQGLNDQHVDKQLLFLVTQHADFGSKLGAIREYNKLKQRITERFEHSGEVAFRGLDDAQLEALALGTAGSSKRRTSA
jgi:hypothetical protein